MKYLKHLKYVKHLKYKILRFIFVLLPLVLLFFWVWYFSNVVRLDFSSQLQYLLNNKLYEESYYKLKIY